MSATIEGVIACQSRLLAALDARAVEAIENETAALARLLAALKGAPSEPSRIEHARKQTEAARIRVNVLSDWTRQRIDRLAELRGQPSNKPVGTYAKPRSFSSRA